MKESFRTKLFRWGFNFWPCYRGTGARVTFISADWREIRVKLPLNWRTRNYVGTTFGGSMYGAVDPIYMIQLIKILGKDYIVWDKAAAIQFKKPGRSTLFARFVFTEEEIREIIRLVEGAPSIDRIYSVELKDAEGNVYARMEKTLFIRKKEK
jgi:acyl-coenzyme A thioesterase PaaI-like protein